MRQVTIARVAAAPAGRPRRLGSSGTLLVFALIAGIEPPPAAAQLSPDLLRGAWQARFSLTVVHHRRVQHPHSPILGTVSFPASVPTAGDLIGTYQFDLRPLLGRADPCIPKTGHPVGRAFADSLQILFTPHAFECGLVAFVVPARDSLRGHWYQRSSTGHAREGDLVLRRVPRPGGKPPRKPGSPAIKPAE